MELELEELESSAIDDELAVEVCGSESSRRAQVSTALGHSLEIGAVWWMWPSNDRAACSMPAGAPPRAQEPAEPGVEGRGEQSGKTPATPASP
ncbi:hypothetical protein LRP30_29400 [Bradyrhizobium sp. C-145]|uniref:hypothetical protein n=1 Tax=Bradyrhizobium sp. C-145 TaxID=574727 RepID=UPI00201B6998|nr:hypothetical protein [Bradyrhizobium sp. C-145]UQR61071.1 hypothetical protein LRP30_29400 [Bradyrhizobium sp. C-145]